MIFFFDANISHKYPRRLQPAFPSHRFRAYRQCFRKPNVPDLEWLEELARWKPKPVIVAGDARILRNPAEREALRIGNFMFVFLSGEWINLPFGTQEELLLQTWPKLLNCLEAREFPSILEVRLPRLRIADLGPTGAFPGQHVKRRVLVDPT